MSLASLTPRNSALTWKRASKASLGPLGAAATLWSAALERENPVQFRLPWFILRVWWTRTLWLNA